MAALEHSISAPPQGSCFVVDVDEEARPRLSWMGPTGGVFRYFPMIFLGFWLCGWAAGEVFAIGALTGIFGGGAMAQGGGIPATLFLCVWLCLWTLGGSAAIYMFVTLIRGPRPERIVLGSDSLYHDPGMSIMFPPNRYDFSQWNRMMPWNRGKRRTMTREAVGNLKLERVGERQRLTVDVGAQRVEIGTSLTEPEREWLADVLRTWAGTRMA